MTAAPVDQLASGFLKERSTGAAQLTNPLPNLPDIDAFVSSFQSQAAVTVASSGDVPCGAGSLKSFANGSTLQVVTVVEVDVAQLNSCGWLNSSKILYSQLPLRLVNGQTLNAPLTIASPQAVYIKGNFNSITPKPSSVVTGNRTYHLSGTFKDYSSFITPAPLTTLVDTIAGYPIATSANYATFITNYNDPAGAGTMLPPTSSWLKTYATSTTQYMAIVSPARDTAPDDRNWYTKYGLLEDWSQVGSSSIYVPPAKAGGGDPPSVLRRVGAFINLMDLDSTFLADGVTPQDRRAIGTAGQLKRNRVYNEPEHIIEYDPAFTTQTPPGFQGNGQGRQVYWAHKTQ